MALAELSHGIERVALTLAEEALDTRLIAHELVSVAAGQREALALALSYVFRKDALGTFEDKAALDAAARAITLALSETPAPAP